MQPLHIASAALVGLASMLHAQGRSDYYNVETPQVKPITVARIANHDYVLACNTPDNSVEVWDTDETIVPASNRFLARIPVGLEPCSVVWNATLGKLFTTDFLSDSVTIVSLTAPTGPTSLSFRVDRTRNVGDEPVHLAFTPDNATVLVSFMSQHALGAFAATDLAPIAPTAVFPAPTQRIDMLSPSGQNGVREPRTIAVNSGRVLCIAHKGGNEPGVHDLDLYSKDLSTGTTTALGGLGSTNSNLAFAANGDLWVVGGFARNTQLIGGPVVAAAATGFVKSQLHLVQRPGQSTVAVTTRDLNEKFDTGTGAAVPVTFDEALALPTDVLALEFGGVTKIFIAAMGSDRVGVVFPTAAPATQWAIKRITITPITGGRAAGPRGMAWKVRSATLTDRIYVLNRLDQSVTILDPIGEAAIGSFALHRDPTPAHIRDGRRFLYGANLSATGFVACASCHMDARTDGLGWDLGATTGQGAPFPPPFPDSPQAITQAQINNHIINGFPTDKQLMVTQSLQGLLNTDAEPVTAGHVTNAPYHWRGDRADFTKFNEAFVNLFGLANIGTPSDPRGIPTGQMAAFADFINSVNYPPNPNQPLDRVYSSGALSGRDLFHTQRLPASGSGRSCVECHALPEGSNNHFTVNITGGVPQSQSRQPIETATLRGLFQKEVRLERAAGNVGTVVLGSSGLEHAGPRVSVNDFINIFAGQFAAPELLDVKRFVREFDWAVGPVVGQVETLLPPIGASQPRLDLFEAQARLANAALAIRIALSNGAWRGFRFDPTRDRYVEEGATGLVLDRGQVLALASGAGARALCLATPLGSERRVADPDGQADPLPVSTPNQLAVLPLAPNTANATVPSLTKNWIPGAGANDFLWNNSAGLPSPLTLHAMRLMQLALIQAGGLGITGMRHDPPRRFRVQGVGIQPGAVLLLHTPDDPAGTAPNPSGPLSQIITKQLTIPLHPTGPIGGVPANTPAVWESALEVDAMTYYTMMVGNAFAPGVTAALTDVNLMILESSTSTAMSPATHNWHFARLQNPGQAPVDLGWVRIRL